jgi:hypothetical protein
MMHVEGVPSDFARELLAIPKHTPEPCHALNHSGRVVIYDLVGILVGMATLDMRVVDWLELQDRPLRYNFGDVVSGRTVLT